MYPRRERCWLVHRRRQGWNECPLCGAPIKWLRLWDGQYSPCDEEPVLYVVDAKHLSKLKIISHRDFVDHVLLKIPVGSKPKYGRLPHYYSCPVLINERRAWAKANG